MQYWLIKTDPETYSWEDLQRDGSTFWDGVRNYQARNFMKDMQKGDLALFYLSQQDKAVCGVVEITRPHYQDPTTDDDRWVAVDVKPLYALKKLVTLAEIKAEPELAEMKLIRSSRLSVMPVTEKEFEKIVNMGGKN